ncbi:hypothetical protein PIB30_064159 [Stylosanthes scabra]|uniref:Secreted protein n=1 Tax=Stylosanthes scabra TaxID=79078 RepID=A0ABU6WLM6_9FABA|nr:hypothetical protein [Stylosanthes scabra]
MVVVAPSCSRPSFASALRVSCIRWSMLRFPLLSTSPLSVPFSSHFGSSTSFRRRLDSSSLDSGCFDFLSRNDCSELLQRLFIVFLRSLIKPSQIASALGFASIILSHV